MMKKMLALTSILLLCSTNAMDIEQDNQTDVLQKPIAWFYLKSKNRNNQLSVIFYDKNHIHIRSIKNIQATDNPLQEAANKLNIQLAQNIELEPNPDYLNPSVYKILYS